MKKRTTLILALVVVALVILALVITALTGKDKYASPTELLNTAVEAGRPLSVKVGFEGGEMPMDADTAQIVNEILGALSLRFDAQKGDVSQSNLALALSDKDVLTFALAEKAEEYYLKSNMLGEDTIAFTVEESTAIVDRIMMKLLETGEIRTSDAISVKQLLSIMTSGFSKEKFDPKSLDFSELTAYINGITERAKTEKVTAQPGNCDQAKTMTSFSMTGEEIAKVCELAFKTLQNNGAFMAQMDQMLQSTGSSSATGKELMDGMITMMNETFMNLPGDVPFTIYKNAKGDPVYATMRMAIRENNYDDDTITMTVEYARLTVNEGVTYHVDLIAKEDGDAADGASMTASVLEGEKLTTADFAMAQIDDGVTKKPLISIAYKLNKDRTKTTAKDQMILDIVSVDDWTEEETGCTIKADLNGEKKDDDATLKVDVKFILRGAEKEMFTVKVDAATGTAAPLIGTDVAVRLASMDDDEFKAFVDQKVQSMQVSLINVVQNLPSSTLLKILKMTTNY